MTIKRFGFRVIEEEQDNGKYTERKYSSDYPYIIDQSQKIRFIEVELNTPQYCEKAYCSMYYKRYMARTEIMEWKTLKKLFPKSYAELDSGEQYDLEFPQERWPND